MRLFHDPPALGAWNMAVDEALLRFVEDGASPPTLRLYEWSSPTISLGYFQPLDSTPNLGQGADVAPFSGKLPVVRRLTGGGAILHDLELTYSLILPLGHPLLSNGPNAVYEKMHDAVIAALGELGVAAWRGCRTDDSTAARGPFFCFARRHCFDVLVGQEKIAGSAQRRTRRGFLQHGSIILGSRFEDQPAAKTRLEATEAVAALRVSLPKALTQSCEVEFEESVLNELEGNRAAALVRKYEGDAWTRRSLKGGAR